MKKNKIILADGNRLFIDALKLILERESDFAVISSESSGIAAIKKAQELDPDVVVVGEVMHDISMFMVARELKRDNKKIRFLFIVKDKNPDLLTLLGEMENVGVVQEKSDMTEFMTALRSVARNERYISPEVITNLRTVVPRKEKIYDPLDDITQREREILYWVANGLTNKEISKTMFLSEKTVKNHVSHILKKLGLQDRTKAAVLAWKEGLPMMPEEYYSVSDMNLV
jgi:DNA-binding NarL/FixJ family response regulator